MLTSHKIFALAVLAALGASPAAQAQNSSFTYIEGGFIAGFVNDVEEAFDDGGTLDLESDSGAGGFIGGAWEFRDNFHLFGDYSLAGQELEVSDGTDSAEGEYDVVRWRIGVGYDYPLSERTSVYGRLSFDTAELTNFEVAGFDISGGVDEDGVGGEVGVLWAATETIDLQGHVRYTSVGEVVTDGSDIFDSDTLVPVGEAREFVRALAEKSSEPIAYAEIPGAQHAFELFPSARSLSVNEQVGRFLEWAHARHQESTPS